MASQSPSFDPSQKKTTEEAPYAFTYRLGLLLVKIRMLLAPAGQVWIVSRPTDPWTSAYHARVNREDR